MSRMPNPKPFGSVFKGHPSDPIEFLYRENFITLSSIGSIFTFGLVANFRANVFDKMMNYILPLESFDFMKVEMPDIGPAPPLQALNPLNPADLVAVGGSNTIDFGPFVREAIIWIIVIFVLYLMGLGLRFPDVPGGNKTGAAIM